MNNYIFLTHEGYTYQPNSNEVMPDIDNLQVIGFAQGEDSNQAFINLIESNPFLLTTSFYNIFCYKLDDKYLDSKKTFIMNQQDLKQKKL